MDNCFIAWERIEILLQKAVEPGRDIDDWSELLEARLADYQSAVQVRYEHLPPAGDTGPEWITWGSDETGEGVRPGWPLCFMLEAWVTDWGIDAWAKLMTETEEFCSDLLSFLKICYDTILGIVPRLFSVTMWQAKFSSDPTIYSHLPGTLQYEIAMGRKLFKALRATLFERKLMCRVAKTNFSFLLQDEKSFISEALHYFCDLTVPNNSLQELAAWKIVKVMLKDVKPTVDPHNSHSMFIFLSFLENRELSQTAKQLIFEAAQRLTVCCWCKSISQFIGCEFKVNEAT